MQLGTVAAKTTPVDADRLLATDSASSPTHKVVYFTWANIKAAILAYFTDVVTTWTNKRITKRVSTETSSATPTINTDNVDLHIITALAANISNFSTNVTGTPVQGDLLRIIIVPTATRTISWGTKFEASTVALPTSVTTTTDYGFRWNTTTSKWRIIAVA